MNRLLTLVVFVLLPACTVTYQGPTPRAPMTTCYANGFCVTTQTNTQPTGVYVAPRPQRLCVDAYGYAHPCPRPIHRRVRHVQHHHGPQCAHTTTVRPVHPVNAGGPPHGGRSKPAHTPSRARPAPQRSKGAGSAAGRQTAPQAPTGPRTDRVPHKAKARSATPPGPRPSRRSR